MTTKLRIDPDELTLDEIEELETILGGGIDGIFNQGSPKGHALKALIWIISKRDNPDFTLEDAGKLRLADIDLGEADPE